MLQQPLLCSLFIVSVLGEGHDQAAKTDHRKGDGDQEAGMGDLDNFKDHQNEVFVVGKYVAGHDEKKDAEQKIFDAFFHGDPLLSFDAIMIKHGGK